MGIAQPGSHQPSKPLLTEFTSLDADLDFLDRLRQHHALRMIAEIHERELETTETINGLAEFYTKVNACIESGYSLVRQRWMRPQAAKWLRSLKEIAAEAVIERFDRGLRPRKGLVSHLPERYFYGACLIPYTAFLNSKKGHKPKWDLIGRWIKDAAGLDVGDIEAWWRKEVVKRKSWPAQSLLFALHEGAAVFLEAADGKMPMWTLEWSPLDKESKPIAAMSSCRLKKKLSKQDEGYLAHAFEHVPLIRRNFTALYPETAARIKTHVPDPLEAILKWERSKILKTAASAGIKKKFAALEALLHKKDFNEKDARVLRGLLADDWYKLAPLLQVRLKHMRRPDDSG